MHNLGFLICLRFHLGEQPILCGDVKVYEGSAIFVIGEDNNHYSTNGKIISLDQSVMGMVLCGGQKGVSNRSRIIFRTRCQGTWRIDHVDATGAKVKGIKKQYTFSSPESTSADWAWSFEEQEASWAEFKSRLNAISQPWNLDAKSQTVAIDLIGDTEEKTEKTLQSRARRSQKKVQRLGSTASPEKKKSPAAASKGQKRKSPVRPLPKTTQKQPPEKKTKGPGADGRRLPPTSDPPPSNNASRGIGAIHDHGRGGYGARGGGGLGNDGGGEHQGNALQQQLANLREVVSFANEVRTMFATPPQPAAPGNFI